MSEKGGISVQTQHIFPVIKKWLYSEKDIFLREVVSNASDAITKVKHLSAIGEAKNVDGDFVIKTQAHFPLLITVSVCLKKRLRSI